MSSMHTPFCSTAVFSLSFVSSEENEAPVFTPTIQPGRGEIHLTGKAVYVQEQIACGNAFSIQEDVKQLAARLFGENRLHSRHTYQVTATHNAGAKRTLVHCTNEVRSLFDINFQVIGKPPQRRGMMALFLLNTVDGIKVVKRPGAEREFLWDSLDDAEEGFPLAPVEKADSLIKALLNPTTMPIASKDQKDVEVANEVEEIVPKGLIREIYREGKKEVIIRELVEVRSSGRADGGLYTHTVLVLATLDVVSLAGNWEGVLKGGAYSVIGMEEARQSTDPLVQTALTEAQANDFHEVGRVERAVEYVAPLAVKYLAPLGAKVFSIVSPWFGQVKALVNAHGSNQALPTA